jgi:hypothetical protein
MEINGNKNKQKTSKKYVCELCHYYTVRKSNMNNHITTAKHKMEMVGNNFKQILSNNNYQCEICNKIYQTNAGLWKHKKICKNKINITENLYNSNEPTDKELIMMLLKQNSQLIEQNNELTKNGITYHSHNTNTNSHNKTFNLQFFLNETCKDAMNIMDFVDSIKLQLTDLENVGKLGYVEGISNIITSNLKALDVNQRPIHCADKKRDIIYVKDQDKWEKEEEDKQKIRKAIKRVMCKNQRLIQKFKEEHPDCLKSSSKFSDQYNKIIVESMGGSGDNDFEKENKIIKNITKFSVIDKD